MLVIKQIICYANCIFYLMLCYFQFYGATTNFSFYKLRASLMACKCKCEIRVGSFISILKTLSS